MDHDTAIRALGALAQPSRLAVFRFLVARGPDGAAAGAVAEALSIPAATLSFHLKELREADWVVCECLGRLRIYRANFARGNELIAFLGENCCGGKPGREKKAAAAA